MSFIKEKSWYSQEYPCVVIMNLNTGCRCGYVAVPKDHALYGVRYNESSHKLAPYYEVIASKREVTVDCLMDNIGIIPTFILMRSKDSRVQPGYVLGVHGGITYSGGGSYPVPMEDYWWFGYDCNHAGDAPDLNMLPDRIREIQERYPIYGGVHRTLDYCFYECIKLADQLRQVDVEYKRRKEILSRNFK